AIRVIFTANLIIAVAPFNLIDGFYVLCRTVPFKKISTLNTTHLYCLVLEDQAGAASAGQEAAYTGIRRRCVSADGRRGDMVLTQHLKRIVVAGANDT